MEIVKDKILRGRKVFISKDGKVIGQGRRTIKDGSNFTHLIKVEDVKNKSSLKYGNVNDTVLMMSDIIEKYHYQVNDLAQFLKKESELGTCRSIWNFVFNHIQYKRDKIEREQISTPARLWLNRSKEGTPSDCDEHAIMCGSLLYCLGIPFKIRIAGYDGKPFSHVYIVTQSNICIDTVLHAFNKEAFYTSKQDSKVMQIEFLHGHDNDNEELGSLGVIDTLQKYADDYDAQAVNFVDTDKLDEIKPETTALNGIENALKEEEDALKTLAKGQMKATLEAYEKEPKLYEAKGFTSQYWIYFRKAYQALVSGQSLDGIIVNLSSGAEWEKNNLNPVNGIENDWGETVGYLGALEGFFKKIRRGFKKFGKWTAKQAKKLAKPIKKFTKWAVKQLKAIGKFLMKINPICIAVRALLRKKIKSNKKNMAIKMGYGLLTQKQAASIGLAAKDWAEAKRTYAKFAKKYSFFGGSTSKLRRTLLTAWYEHSKKQGLQTIKLHGMETPEYLGQLEGRRRRRRRRRRRARREAARKAALALQKKYNIAKKKYEDDKRENQAAERKLKNRSRWEKERIAFLKEVFPKESKGIKGLGEPATVASTGAAAGIVAKLMAWLMKFLKKIGLGGVVKKIKEKHIENLKKKIAAAPSEIAKRALEKKLKKAETNLVIFESYGKGKNQTNNQPQKPDSGSSVISTPTPSKPFPEGQPLKAKTNKASMGTLGMVALALVGGGLLLGKDEKNKNNNKHQNKK